MFAFATMEEEVNRLLEDYVRDDLLGLKKAPPRSAEIIKALISGMRISAAKDTIKRLLRVADAPAAADREGGANRPLVRKAHFLRW